MYCSSAYLPHVKYLVIHRRLVKVYERDNVYVQYLWNVLRESFGLDFHWTSDARPKKIGMKVQNSVTAHSFASKKANSCWTVANFKKQDQSVTPLFQ